MMQSKLIFLVLAVALGRTLCLKNNLVFTRVSSPKQGNSSVGIYDGTKITIDKVPWTASLLQDGVPVCAATIVSRGWAVTVGACVYHTDATHLRIVAGSQNGVNGKTYQVKQVIRHPNYNPFSFDYDYACLQIQGKFKWSKKVRAIKLGGKPPKPNTMMSTAGWGQTSLEDETAGLQLYQGNMKWLSDAACKKFLESISVDWTPRMACAYNKGKTTLCVGDWGDAFVLDKGFYGFFSFVSANGLCTNQAQPIGLANLNAVLPWIKKTTGAKIQGEDEDEEEQPSEDVR